MNGEGFAYFRYMTHLHMKYYSHNLPISARITRSDLLGWAVRQRRALGLPTDFISMLGFL